VKRILYMAPTSKIGGAERSLLELIGGLPRDRYEPFLLIPGEGPLADRARSLGTTVITDGWPAPLLRLGRERTLMNRMLPILAPALILPLLIRVARVVNEEGIDLIHTNGIKAHLAAWPAACAYRIPLVWHLRDVLSPGLLRSGLRWITGWMPDLVIANSKASAESTALGTPADRVRTIYNGLDTVEFAPHPPDPFLRDALGIGRDDFVIGALGMLTPLKGHIHLIRALPRILEEVPGARLMIVGEEMYVTAGHGGYRRVLIDEIRRLELEKKVVLTGRRDDVVRIYNTMDIVVLCSVRPESFGRVLVEAMSCERPVIGSDIGGPREIITRPEVGVLVPPADHEALSSTILELYHDPGRRLRMSRAARMWVRERFALERHVRDVCEAYEALLGPAAAHATGAVAS